MNTINLLVPSYNLFRYNLEKMESETGKNIRLVCIPWHYNDAAMREFFSTAYPSVFSMDEGVFYNGEFHYFSREHEARLRSSEDKLFPAKQVSYENAMFLGRKDNFPDEKSVESEMNEMIDQIRNWFDSNAKTIIDLSSLQHEDAEKNIALFRKQEEVLSLSGKIATEFNGYIFFFDPFAEIPSIQKSFSWTDADLHMPKAVDFSRISLDSAKVHETIPEILRECDRQHQDALTEYLKTL